MTSTIEKSKMRQRQTKNAHDQSVVFGDISEALNEDFRQALFHYIQYKDSRIINNLLKKFPPTTLKSSILPYVTVRLPFKANDKGDGIIADKERLRFMTEQIICMFNIMDALQTKKAEDLSYQNRICEIGADEFVSEIADILTIHRRKFSPAQVEYLIDILNMMQSQKAKTGSYRT